jgi:hypothetical protein
LASSSKLDASQLDKALVELLTNFRTWLSRHETTRVQSEAVAFAAKLGMNSSALVSVACSVAREAGSLRAPSVEYDFDPEYPEDRYIRLRIAVKGGAREFIHAAASARKALREAVPLDHLEYFRTAIVLEQSSAR